MITTKHFKQATASVLLFGFVCSVVLLPVFSPRVSHAQVVADENTPNPVANTGVYQPNVSLIDPKYEPKNDFIPGLTKLDGSEAGNQYSIYDGNDPYGLIDPATGVPVFFGATTQNTQGITEATDIGSGKVPDPGNLLFGCQLSKITQEGTVYACLAAGTYYLFFKPAYMLAGWTSILLNFVIQQLVVGMGALVAKLDGIMVAWQTLRDLANVFLVFLTIYVGIATILGLSKYGNKQLLWKIVLSALLVNFSVTFTKAVIDVSNLAAVETYRQFMLSANPSAAGCVNQSTPSEKGTTKDDPCVNKGLAGAFWTQLKITTIFNMEELRKNIPTAKTSDADLKWAMTIMAVMGGFMCLVMAFVFGGAAFLLIGRFVILVFLIIVSPVALVAWLTDVSPLGSKWWKTLLDQAFFAPAILLMWWIAYKVLGSYVLLFVNGSLSSSLASPGTGGDISSLGIVLMFIVVMSFLIMGLVIAKQLGAYGAQTVINTGKVGAAATAGLIAANTLGAASAAAQRRYTEKVAAAQQSEGRFSKANPLKYIAGTKLDRGLSAAAGAGANMKFAGRSSFTERKLANQKNKSARQEEITTTGKQADLRRAMNTVNDGTHQWMERNNQASPELEKAKKTIAGASQADIEKLRTSSPGIFRNNADTTAMHNAFSKKQASALAGKADTTPAQKKSLTESAYKGEREAIRATTRTSEHVTKIQSMTSADIKENASVLKENPSAVAHMSPAMFKQIMENKDDVFDSDALIDFANKRKEHFKTLTGDALKKAVQTSKPADLAEHDISFLSKPEFLQHTDTQILSEMQKHGLTKEKRDAMKVKVDELFRALPSGGSSTLVDQNGNPLPSQPLTPEQQNIVALHNWFNNGGRFTV
jgi:hypothetical protein